MNQSNDDNNNQAKASQAQTRDNNNNNNNNNKNMKKKLPEVYLANGTSKRITDSLLNQFKGRLFFRQAIGPANPHADDASSRNTFEVLFRDPRAVRSASGLHGNTVCVAPSLAYMSAAMGGHLIIAGAANGGLMAEDFKRVNAIPALVQKGALKHINNWKVADGMAVTTYCDHLVQECDCMFKRSFEVGGYHFYGLDVFDHLRCEEVGALVHKPGCTGMVYAGHMYTVEEEDGVSIINNGERRCLEITTDGCGVYNTADDWRGLSKGGLFQWGPHLVVCAAYDITIDNRGYCVLRATNSRVGRSLTYLGIVDQQNVEVVAAGGVSFSAVTGKNSDVLTMINGTTKRDFNLPKGAIAIARQTSVPVGATIVGTNVMASLRGRLSAKNMVVSDEALSALCAYGVVVSSRGALNAGIALKALTGIEMVPQQIVDSADEEVIDVEAAQAFSRLTRLNPILADRVHGRQPTGFAALCCIGGCVVFATALVKGWKTTALATAAVGIAGASVCGRVIHDLAKDLWSVIKPKAPHLLALCAIGVLVKCVSYDANSVVAPTTPTLSAMSIATETLACAYGGLVGALITQAGITVVAPLVEEGFKHVAGNIGGVKAAVALGAVYGVWESTQPTMVPIMGIRVVTHSVLGYVTYQSYWAGVISHSMINVALLYYSGLPSGSSQTSVGGGIVKFSNPYVYLLVVWVVAYWVCKAVAWKLKDTDIFTLVDGQFTNGNCVLHNLPRPNGAALAAVCPFRDMHLPIPECRREGIVKWQFNRSDECPVRPGGFVYGGVRGISAAYPSVCIHSAIVSLTYRQLKLQKLVASTAFFINYLSSDEGEVYKSRLRRVGKEVRILSDDEYEARLPTTFLAKEHHDAVNDVATRDLRSFSFTLQVKYERYIYAAMPKHVVSAPLKIVRPRAISAPPAAAKAVINPHIYSFTKAVVPLMAGEDGLGWEIIKYEGDGRELGDIMTRAFTAVKTAQSLLTDYDIELVAVRCDISGCDAATTAAVADFHELNLYAAGVIGKPNPPEGINANPLLELLPNGAPHTADGRFQRTLVWECMRWAKFRLMRSDGSLYVERDSDSMKSGRGDTSINTTLAVGVIARTAVSDCCTMMYGQTLGKQVAKILPVVVQGDDNFVYLPLRRGYDIEEKYKSVFADAGYEIDVNQVGLDGYGAPLVPVCSAHLVPVCGVKQLFLPAQRVGRVVARYFLLPKTIGRHKRMGHIKALAQNLLACSGHVFVLRWLAQSIVKQLKDVEAVHIYDRDDIFRVTYTYPSYVGLDSKETDRRCALFLEQYYCARGASPGFLVSSLDSLQTYLSQWKIGDWFEHQALVTMAEIDA